MKTKIVDENLYEMTVFAYRCNICNDTVISVDTEVSVQCKCKNLTLRGGIEYGGLIASLYDDITDVCEWKLIKGDLNVNIMPRK
jgi:hypothetical protein